MAGLQLDIDLAKIEENAGRLVTWYAARGVEVAGVTKGVCGDAQVAAAMVRGGVHTLADARLDNLARLRQSGLRARYMLIRPPRCSEAERVVQLTDISLNTELSTVRLLAQNARAAGREHQVLLMVELGDLREGVMPGDLVNLAREVQALRGVRLAGIGTNLTCLNGVYPSEAKMRVLSDLANEVEAALGQRLVLVSGGNSANHHWLMETEDLGRVNQLRLGELLLLGRETLLNRQVTGLHRDAFCLRAEVIEVKTKPSVPWGQRGRNAFGERPSAERQGSMRRAIVAVGRQDTEPDGLTPLGPYEIIGSSSDQLVLHDRTGALQVGSRVSFVPDYVALMRAMTSPYVARRYCSASTVEHRAGRVLGAHLDRPGVARDSLH